MLYYRACFGLGLVQVFRFQSLPNLVRRLLIAHFKLQLKLFLQLLLCPEIDDVHLVIAPHIVYELRDILFLEDMFGTTEPRSKTKPKSKPNVKIFWDFPLKHGPMRRDVNYLAFARKAW